MCANPSIRAHATSLRRLLLWLLPCVALLRAVAAPAPLTWIGDIYALPSAELRKHPEATLRAVITYSDPAFGMLFVEDESGGLYVYRPNAGADLRAGDAVQLDGVATPGLFAPIITAPRITILHKTNLPPAKPLSIAGLLAGHTVSHRVELEGIVERAEPRYGHLSLQLGSGENHCHLWVQTFSTNDVAKLLDARVRVRGVAAARFERNQVTGFELFVNSTSEIEVLHQPATNAFDLPPLTAHELWSAAARQAGEHRVRAGGIVTLHWPGQTTVIQDATGGIVLDGVFGTKVKVGDEVDVAGFAVSPLHGARLRHCEARVRGTNQLVEPLTLTRVETKGASNRLVRLTGRVLEWQKLADTRRAILDCDHALVMLAVPGTNTGVEARLPAGSTLEAVGVLLGSNSSSSSLPSLWTRSVEDLSLRSSPSQTVKQTHFLAAMTGAGVLAAITVAITLIHRRTAARFRAQEKGLQEQFVETERQLRRSQNERDAIGRELHDNTIQSIYSVGLTLEEAQRWTHKDPVRAHQRIGIAIQTLNSLIRDLRAFIGGIELKKLEGHELKTALKSVLISSSEEMAARFSIQIDASATRELTSAQATEIFYIAREAMMNSIRHAQAEHTTVSLQPQGRSVRLEVYDNGVGFNPAAVNGVAMGLRHIRRRAEQLGAHLDIRSTPGQGTRLTLDVPLITP
jgi:signal transduction histidine kinase